MTSADAAVLDTLEQDILHPTALQRAIALAVERYGAGPGDLEAQRAGLQAELQRVETEIAKLEGDLASGAPWSLIQEPLESRRRRRQDLQAQLAHIDTQARLPRLDPAALTAELTERLADWRGLLRAEPVQSRQLLRKIIVGRLAFEPDFDRGLYHFTGQASYGRLLAGSVQNMWCPRGDSNTRPAV